MLSLAVGTGWLSYIYWLSDFTDADTPIWTHQFPGKGMIYSVAATKRNDGLEVVVAGGYAVTDNSGSDLRIVAFAADTGHKLWEQREKGSIAPYMNREPLVSFDADGNVLCGAELAAVGQGFERSLTKLSIKDGKELWRWSAESLGDRYPSTGYGHMARAAGLSRGYIWVSGIRSLAERTYERFLALLDSKDGRQMWFTSLNAADDGFDRPAEVHPLPAKDAFLVIPPRHHERSYPWLLERIDETTGTTEWRRELIRDNERNLTEPFFLVDEHHDEALVFWHQVVSGSWQSEVIAFSLTDGRELRRVKSDYPKHFSGGMRGASMTAKGEITLYGAEEWTESKANWLKWDKDPELPIPLPEMNSLRHVRPLAVTISPTDGRILSKTRLSDRDEAPTQLLYEPASQEARVMFVRTMITRSQLESWRSIRLGTATHGPQANGLESKNDYPRVATITPSGKIITTGDPSEKEVIWRIEAW
jgi:outer membrane protein assembly factor BamB